MHIETKYDLETSVWVVHKNKAKKALIIDITLCKGYDEPMYRLAFENSTDTCYRMESELFSTKEQLLSYVASE